MLRPLIFLASLAAVLGEGVVLESTYADDDMAAEATIVREGFAYPGGHIGYGSSGYSYAAKTPLYGSLGAIQALPPPYQHQYLPAQDLDSIKYSYIPQRPPPPPQTLYSPKYVPVSYAPIAIPIPYGHGAQGGEYLDKSAFDEAKKQLQDQQYHNAHGRKGEEFQHGQQGFQQGQQALKDVKADSGYYSGEEGAKRLAEDAKNYYGNRHYNKEGQNQAERKNKQNHKKGHVVKGFKKSHHLEETGRNEEFYDQDHDEGDNSEYSGQQGGFGQSEGSSFKGLNEDKQFKANQAKKQGHFSNEQLNDNSHGNNEHYGSRKYGDSGSSYGAKNAADEQSLLAHQQSNKFFKNQPHHVPFYHSY